MSQRGMYLILLCLLIEQLVAQDMRSLKMFVFNGLEFQCVNTTCIPYANRTTEGVLKCRITCLSLLQCKAASFYQSALVCQLFTDTSIQNANMLGNSNVISLIVQSGTRIPPGKWYRLKLCFLRKSKATDTKAYGRD
ncbi:unnamed protein product [Adineta ricciae]|uniref:Apple domain-containing protein n=1 Tax=Adineta ricciae TaxID=249248 RepID=A0A815ZYU8_ADIRI|nr:unnamed protein product [Adineta ricciae]